MADQCVMIDRIYDLLYKIGATANYTGFFHTARAVFIAQQNPEALAAVTKWLYPEVADQYGTNWRAVERNIRYVISEVWHDHPNRLSRLAGERLPRKPTPAEFIALLAKELQK